MKIFNLIILIIGINCQYSNYCSDDPRCRCHSIVSSCTRAGLNRVPKIQQNSIIFDLRENYITKIDYGIFFSLRKLRSLFLSNNRITELEAYAFVGLDELKDLHLYENSIEKIHPLAFYNLKNLETLYLQQNKIKKLDTSTFDNLLKLERLLLTSNLISAFQENLIKPLINLKSLRLDDNRLNCDCDMYWLWKAIQPVSYQYRVYNFSISASCYTPNEFRNKKISSLNKLDFKCIEPLIVEAPNDVEISMNSLNSLVQFECKAIGYPVPTIQWFKDGRRLFSDKYSISDEGNLISIREVNENDAGRYECHALSDFGQAKASANFKIIKESIDELEFKSEHQRNKLNNFIVENDIIVLDSNEIQHQTPLKHYFLIMIN
ncbi:peroxidasin -like protein [Brachionus plicatilis]|uniref:Peroxidasin-like protein n=1 Tax=Brachionus plicatilis TaxID=10195 RepID=A0A3M7PUM7_BRAPC|nr:peroxidasin -like protein [Brachionus plicatilis]